MAATTGTGMQNPPITLVNTANALTQKHIMPILADVVMNPSAVLWAFNRLGKKFHGGELIYPVITQELPEGGAYYGDQLLTTAVVDAIVPANQVWRSYYQTFTVPILDVVLNRGGAMGLDLLKSQYQIACASLLQKMSRALWGTSPQNTSLDVDHIPNWVRETTNTIAGIARGGAYSTTNYWSPPANVAGGSTALNATKAEEAVMSATWGYDTPNLLLLDNTRYAAFKSTFTALIQYDNNLQDSEAIQAGFRKHFMYDSCLVLPDRHVIAQQAYFLNTKYIFPVFHEADYFTVDPFQKPTNQRVLTSAIYVTWQVANVGPRMHVAVTSLA